jgi:hypothetical protein
MITINDLTRSFIVSIGAGLLLTGCVPFPHFVTLVPHISGTVTKSGVPQKNVQIYLSKSYRNPCSEKAEPLFITDMNGDFNLEEMTAFRWLYVPMVAPISVTEYTLCAATSDSSFIGYKGLTRRYGDNEDVLLLCDIDHPRLVKFGDGTMTESICETVSKE